MNGIYLIPTEQLASRQNKGDRALVLAGDELGSDADRADINFGLGGISATTSGDLSLADAGRTINATGDLNIPADVFPAGASVVINNTTGSAILITTDIDLRLAGTATTGSVQLAAYGICGIFFQSTTLAKVSGTGLAAIGDAEAEAFFSAAGITDEGVRSAVSDLVLGLKADSLWDKMVAIYPFVQDPAANSLVPQSFNLKDPTEYQITWASAPTPSDNGVVGDGVDDYGDTGLDLVGLNAASFAFGFYSRTNQDASMIPMGAWDSGTGDGVNIYPRLSGVCYGDNTFNGGTGRLSAAVADSLGLFVASRTAAGAHELYKNGASLASGAGAGLAFTSMNMFLLVRGGGTAFSSHQLSFAFVSSGLNDTEVGNLYTNVQAFQTALGRAV